jgi:hypothetical protein
VRADRPLPCYFFTQICVFIFTVVFPTGGRGGDDGAARPIRPTDERSKMVEHGRYLASIGACAACHTPPDVPRERPLPGDIAGIERDRKCRTDPDWFAYLDPTGRSHLSGGVPFNLRFSGSSSGVVYSSNITPDPGTGLGNWTEDEIVAAIRSGERKPGTGPDRLYLFPPHSFFANLAEDDARALAAYLKSVPPVKNEGLAIQSRQRHLPPDQAPSRSPAVTGLKVAPSGRSLERARYLVGAIVGCRECHSYQKFTSSGPVLQEYVGGDPSDPFLGVFRLGPDLPLRPDEKGFAVFPYPGYAVLYSGNLTRFGRGGDLSHVSADDIVRSIRDGVSTEPDKYGRPRPLSHVMLWQFYRHMTDDDAYSIADYLKTLKYVPHRVEPRLLHFGTDWEAAFRQVFGPFDSMTGGKSEVITDPDRHILGKPPM